MKLYEITDSMSALEAMLEDETLTDEDTRKAIADTLESLEGDLADKAENITKLIRNYQAEADSCKQEADRFAKRAKSCENKVKSLKQYLTGAMQAAGRDKMKAGLFNLTLRASGQRAITYKVKAEAIYNTLANDVTNEVPATLLKKHADCVIYCDADSASLLTEELIEAYR